MAGLEASIATLISRLETVTARLEAVESQLGAGGAPASSSSSSSSSGASGVEPAAWFAKFDAAASALLPALSGAIDKIGTPELKAQGAAFASLVEAQRKFLFIVATSKKPDDATFGNLLADMGAKINDVITIRDKARGNAAWNHLSALSELVPGFGWVQVSPTPGPHWKDFTGNSQFYSNKLIREYKGKDDNQMAFVNALHNFEAEIAALIKESHTTGLVWNARGGDASAAAGAAAAAAPAPVGPPAGGPPPPAPPPAGLLTSPAPAKGGDASALFAAINQGGAITSGLRKVTKDMKTKGQPKSSVVPAIEKKETPAAAKPKFGSAVKKGTPKFELQGNKWAVDWQEGNKSIVIADTQPKHTVYVYNCTNSVVQIKGKVNAVTLDGCKKVGLAFENVVASVELVNCSGCEVQALGFVPSFAIDKCSSIQVILSQECLTTEIVSAKSDQLNVVLPPLNPNDDITELAIPEQFKTTIENRVLKTVHVEHV